MASAPPRPGAPPREGWIDLVKGITITLVTLHHIVRSLQQAGVFPADLFALYSYTQPIRMPLFFLVAGLFASKAMTAPTDRFIDTRLVHFMYFYVVWNIISYSLRMALSPVMDTGIDPYSILMIAWKPVVMLWFLYVLALAFLFLRLTRSWPRWLVLVIALALHIATFYGSTGFEVLGNFARFLIFFVVGATFSGEIRRAATRANLLWAAVFAGGYLLLCTQTDNVASWPLYLILAALSTVALIALCKAIETTAVGRAFAWVGTYSLYIYVMNFLATAAVSVALRALGLAPYPLLIVALGTPVAVLLCIAIYEVGRRTPFRFVFVRPEFLHYRRAQPAPAPEVRS